MQHEIINIGGIELHYYTAGSGDPIVIMHGWGCRASTVESIARTAALTHKVYNVDFPGFGDSTEPTETWGVEEYTRIIEKLVAELGIENPVLLGHSFGGRVGILYASRNKVSKLILVDAAGIKPKRQLKYYIKVYSFKLMKKLLPLIYGKAEAEQRIEAARSRNGSSDYASASSRMRAILSKVVNEDLRNCLPKIKAPTLLVWGEDDTATPLKDARVMEKNIPDAGLVSFPHCGHYSFLDNPGQFAAVLQSFLNSK